MAKNKRRYICSGCGCGTDKALPVNNEILCTYCHKVSMGLITPPQPEPKLSYWDIQRQIREGNPSY